MAKTMFSKVIWIFLFSIFATGNSMFNLNCLEENKLCSLVSKEQSPLSPEVKAVSMKCLNEACKDSVVLGDNKELYLCTHLSKKSAECQHLNYKNIGRVSPLSLLDQTSDENSNENLDDSEEMNKRQLPFETLNYGRKRQLPFETLNFGKRRLPFETMLYGRKRSLPFETLNYGKKRAYIPIDGYIMGRR